MFPGYRLFCEKGTPAALAVQSSLRTLLALRAFGEAHSISVRAV
jgi:hypothetical protein